MPSVDTFMNDWPNKDRHVDSTIDATNYYNASRTVLYVAPGSAAAISNGVVTYKTADFKPIGLVQGWNWNEQRDIQQVWELGSDIPTFVPGRAVGGIQISRIIINGRDMANIFANPTTGGGAIADDGAGNKVVIASLKDISKGADLLFVSYATNDLLDSSGKKIVDKNKIVFQRLFRDCWINARSESIGANQVIIAENVSVIYGSMPTVTIGN